MTTIKCLPDFISRLARTYRSKHLLWVVCLFLLGGGGSLGRLSTRPAQAASAVPSVANFDQLQRLTASDRSNSDFLGTSVAVGAGIVLLGASGDDFSGSNDRGSVYVYTRTGTSYVFLQKITANDSQSGDEFGAAVALDDDTLVIGAPGVSSSRGAIYVYTWTGTSFQFQQKLLAGDGAGSDRFGITVDVDGDTAVAGAPADGVGGNSAQGSVYVFKRVGVNWSQQQQLTASDGAADDQFGSAVALTDGTILGGATIIAGAHFDDVSGEANQGSAYVFGFVSGAWMQQQKLTADNGAAGARFGAAVAVSGNTALIGASHRSIGFLGGVGAAYVFERTGTSWNQQQQLVADTPGVNDHFGLQVALHNNTAVVGSENDGTAGVNQGAAYAFTRENGVWSAPQKLVADDAAAGDFLGLAVGVYSQTIVAGAPGDDTGSGAAYVFATPPNAPPTIAAQPVTRSQGGLVLSSSTIANVGDAEDAENGLQVTVEGGANATINNVTVSSISVSATGVVSANVTAACNATTATYTLRVTDSGGAFAQALFTVTVTPNTQPVLSYNNPPTVGLGGGFSFNPVASPTDNGLVQSISVQNITPSFGGTITVNPTGVVTVSNAGPPGNYQVTVQAMDNCGVLRLAPFTLTVTGSCPSISILPQSLPALTAGQPANLQLSGAGGAAPYTFSLNGSLPSGLSLSSSGAIAGTPTVFGGFSIDITATDNNGCMASRTYFLTINPPCPAITVNPTSLPNGSLGVVYSQTVTAGGGAGTYTFDLSAGALPPGLTLAGTGALTGTPTAAGTFNFTIRATSDGCQGTRAYSVVINPVAGNNPGLQFYPLSKPLRLLDTRPGFTGCDSPGAKISGNTSRTQLARRSCDGITIPANAMAVTGNITTVQSGGGYLTLYPSDAAQPLVANSNYAANEIINNVFTVGLGNVDGSFKIFVTSPTDVVVDITGYYAPPAAGGLYFHPLPKPIRLLETRAGFNGAFTPGVKLQADADTPQQSHVSYDGVTIPNTALAIVGNATTINGGAGYMTLYPGGVPRPLAASSNFSAGQVMNAPFTVGLSASGEFNIFTTTGIDVIIDVLGYYSADANDTNGAGLLFNSLPAPVRLLETRAGFTGCYTPNAPLLTGSTRQQQARGACGGQTVANNALAIVGNATVINNQAGYLTFWPNGAAQPLVASSNFAAGQILNRHFTVGLGATGMFNIFASAQTDLIVDVSGFFAP